MISEDELRNSLRKVGNWYLYDGYSINLIGNTVNFFKPDFSMTLNKTTTLAEVMKVAEAIKALKKEGEE